MDGGWDRLASAVRVHSPLASSAPLHWTSFAAPSAQSSPRLATVRPTSLLFSGLQVEHDKLFGNGLHRDLGAGEAEVSMKPDPVDGLVRKPEPRHSTDLRLIATNSQIPCGLGAGPRQNNITCSSPGGAIWKDKFTFVFVVGVSFSYVSAVSLRPSGFRTNLKPSSGFA